LKTLLPMGRRVIGQNPSSANRERDLSLGTFCWVTFRTQDVELPQLDLSDKVENSVSYFY
ncbi:hypothetical protein LT991_09435, partial [Leptospira interrogans serovar Canicola]|uniref:hypothetical protein n=1 Tax=Leptospira interrogans TaxID=173 RepID=UPI001F107A01